MHARRRRRRGGKRRNGFLSVELVQTSRAGDVPRPTTNPLVDSSTLLAPFALSPSDAADASSLVRDPRYTGLLQVGRVVDFSTCLFVEPRERNGKRDEFNLILYACLMKPMSGDDFMPFQLDGSRFDRAESPLTLDAGEISRNLSLSLSLSFQNVFVLLIRRSLQRIKLSCALATRVRGIGVLAC